MAARRTRPYRPTFATVPRRREAPVISIRELRWNARLGVVTQLVYIVGRLPRRARLVAGVALLGAVWAAVALVAAYWPYLLAVLAAWLLWRHGRPRLAAWRQYRRDRAEALEVLGDDDDHGDIPY